MTSSRIRSGGCCVDDRQRFLAAGGGQEDVAFRRQHDLEQLSVVPFVVHDQHARGTFESCRVLRSRSGQLRRDGRQKLLIAHRLGDVAVTTCGADAFLVALHRQGGECDHRNGARRLVALE